MDWLFGSNSSRSEAVQVDAKLSASSTQGRSAPSDGDDSYHKKRGNELFQDKRYREAIAEYTIGITKQPTATLYSNRSAAYCALNEFRHALEDAEAAIALDPTWAKTYSRKGKALYGLHNYKLAADAYARGLALSLHGAVGEANQRDAELEALKKQTDSQAEAYMRLLEENNRLKRALDDYQDLMGDWTKKEL